MKVVAMNLNEIMEDPKTFTEAFMVYKKMFDNDIDKTDPCKLSEDDKNKLFMFVSGYKIGLAVGREKKGENRYATAIVI